MVLSSTYQSTSLPLLSTLYEPPPKHLISVLGHLPQKTGRAVRVPVVFTLRLFVLTTAYGCRVSQGSPGRSRSAGTAGSASSCSGPATRSSCVPSTATVSFMWRTHGSWASS